jgi:hypothetical protein
LTACCVFTIVPRQSAAVEASPTGAKITIFEKTARKLAFCNFAGLFVALDEQFL